MITLNDIRAEADRLLIDAVEGTPLDERTEALINLAVRVSPSTLDMPGTKVYARRALELGASKEQVHEVLALVSGLGVHTLMEGSRRIAEVLREIGDPQIDAPLDEKRQQIWDRRIGKDAYWQTFEKSVPGFLDALIRLSPEAFEGFFDYCAIPWKTNALRALTKEFIAIASDATPTHRYLPGVKLHVVNALKLGAGRVAILQALSIAASAPEHAGIG